jgi:pimeloyl-ACP methyl ester carboxylesterase
MRYAYLCRCGGFEVPFILAASLERRSDFFPHSGEKELQIQGTPNPRNSNLKNSESMNQSGAYTGKCALNFEVHGNGVERLRTRERDTRDGRMNDNINQSFLKNIHVGKGPDVRTIAVRMRAGTPPGLFWLGGFKSDMKGTKACALDLWAGQRGRACTRFDYLGHGESGGKFTDGTIGRWLEDSIAVFDTFCRGPQVVIGSSMGGWLALLLARELRKRTQAQATIAGMVLIAPAVDFTEELMWKKFPSEIKAEMEKTGQWVRPSAYAEEPQIITRNLIEEARQHLLLGGLIESGCPVRILQGVEDPDVPWNHAVDLVARLAHDDVVLTLVKDGDHRLSRPEDIERLLTAISEF